MATAIPGATDGTELIRHKETADKNMSLFVNRHYLTVVLPVFVSMCISSILIEPSYAKQAQATRPAQGKQEFALVAVYYMTFNAETYTAFTPRDIVQGEAYRVHGLNKQELSQIAKLIRPRRTVGHFSSSVTRMLVKLSSGAQILVDRDGMVRYQNQQYRIGAADMRLIDAMMQKHSQHYQYNKQPEITYEERAS